MSSEPLDPYILAQIKARDSASVVKIRFLNFRSLYPEGLILALEGDDDKVVYSRWIARVKPELRYEIFVCGGKRSARQLSRLFISDVNNLAVDVKIIVDRDFDDLEGFPEGIKIYMLERYSFENFLVTSEVLDRVLRFAYPCNGQPRLREKICAIFLSDFEQFLLASRNINERIYLARKLTINIDKIIPKSIDSFVEVSIASTGAIDVNVADLIPFNISCDVDHLLQEFGRLDPESRYRGKFAWKFFVKWLDLLADEFRKPRLSIFSGVEGDKINHSELSMGALADFAVVPTGLGQFLEE